MEKQKGSDPDNTYPYMLDGMTMYLASGDKNKPKAARKARDVAYTQYFDNLQQKTDNGFVLNQKQHNNTLQKPTIAFQRDDIFDFNDIIRNTTNTTSNTTSSKKDGLIQNDNVRFVGENQVRFREKPGMDSSVLGLMDKGTEVEYTGYKTKMIDGHMWAEVIYNGEIGWVAADYLKISNPADTFIANSTETKTKQESTSPDNTGTFSNENQETTDNINSAEQQKLTQKAEPVSRYVGEENVRFRSAPGLNSSIIKEFKKWTELKYTGNKTAEIDGHMWAEVVYDGKTGWIAADYLKISKQAVSNSVNPKSHYETIKSSTSTIENNHSEKLDLSDFSKIQTAFQNYKIADTAVSGDFDGWYGLQCVDLTNWFINEYTTLGKTSGNGCDKVERIANLKDDLEISIIPSAPAVFSISPGKPGPGVANTSDPKYGHTGIVLDVKIVNIPPGSTDPSEYTYAVTYLHTYSNLSKTEQNSSIVTKNFIQNEGVTYVNIGNYLK